MSPDSTECPGERAACARRTGRLTLDIKQQFISYYAVTTGAYKSLVFQKCHSQRGGSDVRLRLCVCVCVCDIYTHKLPSFILSIHTHVHLCRHTDTHTQRTCIHTNIHAHTYIHFRTHVKHTQRPTHTLTAREGVQCFECIACSGWIEP